jgi:2-methylisocitrate lyase-like PEP mutase family enzyme
LELGEAILQQASSTAEPWSGDDVGVLSAPPQSKGAAFRALHKRDGAFVIPNPWDVGTARILANLGFEALATTSAGQAYSLGVPDSKVAIADVLAHCRELVGTTDLPVSADLEKGLGDSPESVAETIRAAAEIGLAGCSIEDFTGSADEPIFAFDLAVERIEAAAEAARALDDDFVLTARCENLRFGIGELADTIERLRAYERAGADVLYAPAVGDLDNIRAVCSALTNPVNVVMGLPGATFSVAELADAGVKRISVGSALARLSITTVIDAATEIREAGTFTFASRALGFAPIEENFRDGA